MPVTENRRPLGRCTGSILVLTVVGAACQTLPRPLFTAAQATPGQVELERRCDDYHLPDPGDTRAPTLTGGRFIANRTNRRVRDGMPPVGVRPRGNHDTNILGFLLQAHGLAAGTEPLDPLSYEKLWLLPERPWPDHQTFV